MKLRFADSKKPINVGIVGKHIPTKDFVAKTAEAIAYSQNKVVEVLPEPEVSMMHGLANYLNNQFTTDMFQVQDLSIPADESNLLWEKGDDMNWEDTDNDLEPAPTLFTQEAMEVMGHMKKELECLHCDANMTCPECGAKIAKDVFSGQRFCTKLSCDWEEHNVLERPEQEREETR
jgi:hypothetical protein